MSSFGPQCYSYGSDENNQFIRVYDAADLGIATFVIIHGGFWKQKYGVDNSAIDTLPAFLQSKGHGVCLIEYRRREHSGGGWPGTNDDIVAALQALFESAASVNKERIVVVGHSAGGTLALWVCSKLSERGLPFRPAVCAAVAPVGDLEQGYLHRLSDEGDAVMLYMKGAPLHRICVETAAASAASISVSIESQASKEDIEVAREKYSRASPHHLLPLEVHTLIVAGGNDTDVPVDVVSAFYNQCVQAVAVSNNNDSSITAGPSANSTDNGTSSSTAIEPRLLVIPQANHYQLMNANDPAWLTIYDNIMQLMQ